MTRFIAIIVEDDDEISGVLSTALGRLGMETIEVRTGAEAVEAARQNEPTIVTIDVGLPGMDGFEVARRIRAFSSCYVIMVTARGEEIDVLEGLGAGADDYIVKPVRIRELRARVDAMLRRPRTGGTVATATPRIGHETVAPRSAEGTEQAVRREPAAQRQQVAPVSMIRPAAPADDELETRLHHGDLLLDMRCRIVELDGNPVELTRYEFDLLTTLMESGRRVCSKASLALALRSNGRGDLGGEYVSDADLRTIDTHIANLRRKLGDDYRDPRVIETVRGVGYRMAAAAAA
ncbi:MAG TPA: response regulator transcription factor [Microbacteriaceae bacterium]|nr:response regulator transcription factor [Microbacteriaceae bacterium]